VKNRYHLNHLVVASVAKARVVEEAVVEMTVEIVIAVAMDVVMTIVKVDVQRIALIKKSVTARILKNHAILQARRKQALLFVTKEINNKKSGSLRWIAFIYKETESHMKK